MSGDRRAALIVHRSSLTTPPGGSMQPNILLILTDQHRPDAMGCAGNPVVQTPNLDRLAAEGVRFSRAYCQGPLCMPARASFLTERYVRDHGVDNNSKAADPDSP